MENILLTSSTFIKTTTNADDNLSDKFLQSAIREAQDVDLQEVIGTKMLNKLKELVSNDSIYNAKYEFHKELLDIAQYFLAYVAIANVIVKTTYKISNIGANTTTDENVQIPKMSDIFQLRDYYLHKADNYRLKLQHFILNNISFLPEISNNKCRAITSHLYSSATSNVFLGGARGKGKGYIILKDKYN